MTHDPAPHPLIELTRTRLREFFREKGALFWVFGFPLLMAMGLGLAFRSKPPDLPRVAVVGDPTASLVRAVLDSPRLHAASSSEGQARRDLARAKVDVVVLVDGGTPTYLLDPTQEKATLARLVAEDVLERAAGRRDVLQARQKTITDPGLRYIDFLLPGLLGLNLMGSSVWGLGYNLVLARKRRLLRRYAVTPMRRYQFLLSYFLSRSFFVLLETAVLVIFGALVFGTVVKGSYFSLVLVAFAGAASFAGISLVVGARVESTESANGWMNLIQLPMWVLSGAFFSYERFPVVLHAPIRVLPLTALVDALRGVWNEGMALGALLPELLVLCLWGGAGFAIALRTFRWQ